MTAILEDYIKRINTHEFYQVKEILLPTSYFTFNEKVWNTPKDVQAYFETAWQTIQEEVYQANEVKTVYQSDETVVYNYQYVYSGYLADGKFIEGGGFATNVFCLVDNQWKLVHEHLNN